MTGSGLTVVKFGTFAIVMVVLTAFLFAVFDQYSTGSTVGYSAVFSDASRLKSGDSVRVSGIRVGTVENVQLREDNTAVVRFNTRRSVALTAQTRVAVRYLNLVGDRYLELVDSPGSMNLLPAGAEIPKDRTSSALDLDLLLGGLKPVIQGLNPQDVNALTASLIEVFQGEGSTFESLLSKTSSFTNTLADNSDTIQQLIGNLRTVLATLSAQGDQFSGVVDRLQRLTAKLSNDREPIGRAIEALDSGTASIADLLAHARAPLADTVDQLSRLAPLLQQDQGHIDGQLQLLPEDYRKMSRLGAYGSFLPVYLCGLSFRLTDLQGRTVQFPWFKEETGRCAEPHA